jgi:threonine efflux protein
MSYTRSFLLIASLYFLAAASPGPNFFIISQWALNGRQSQARRVAIGITVGSTVWATGAVAGLSALLGTFEHLATGLRVAGALYLVWYGVRLLRSALALVPARHSTGPSATTQVSFRTGVFTSLTNPKSAAFWSSVFASTLPNQAPVWFLVLVCCLIAALSASWHLALAAVFARPKLQAAYLSARRPIETVCGGALVTLGLRRVVAW